MAKGIFDSLAKEDITEEIVLPTTNNTDINKDELESLIGIKLSEVEEKHLKEDKDATNKRLKDTSLVLEDLALIARTAENTNEPLNRDLVEIVTRMALTGTNTDPSTLISKDATSDEILEKSKQVSELVISD